MPLTQFLQNYSAICECLKQINDKSYGEVVAKALGLKALMMKFATFFGLKPDHLVFSATEQLSSTLQTHDINAQQAI